MLRRKKKKQLSPSFPWQIKCSVIKEHKKIVHTRAELFLNKMLGM